MNATSGFTIVQLVPDPIANERINVGVIVLHQTHVYHRFIKRLSRVRHFAKDFDLERMHDFERTLYILAEQGPGEGQVGLPFLGGNSHSVTEFVRHAAQNWSHQIQCTPIQPSMEPPLQLLDRLSARYLKEPVIAAREGLSSTQLASRAAHELRIAMPHEALSTHKVEMFQKSPGKVIPHVPVDVRLMNGDLKAAVRAVSFQGTLVKDMIHNWTTALLALSDLKAAHPDAAMSLHAAPPVRTTRDVTSVFDDAGDAAEKARVEFVLIDQTPRWARETIERTIG